MSQSAAVNVPAVRQGGEPWRRNKKLDQYIAFWTIPVFYSLFGLVFVPLSWMMPPRSPEMALVEVVEFMQSPKLQVASTILILSLGLSAVANACYAVQIKRMSVSPVFRYAFLAGSMVGAMVGCLFPMLCFGLGAFRPGYDPGILAMLYDFGYLSFIGSLGCFCLNWMLLSLSILLDKNNILPRWLGYYTVWQYVTELFATTVWISKTGPFAWDGELAFWFNMVIYVPWQFIVYFCVYRAIKNQPQNELDNAEVESSAVCARGSI